MIVNGAARCLATGSNSQRYDGESETFIVEGDSAASTPSLPRLRAGCGRAGETFVTHPLTAGGFDASEDGTGRGVPLVAAPLGAGRAIADTHGDASNVVAFAQNQRHELRDLNGTAGAIAAEPGMQQQTFVAFNHQTGGDMRLGIGDTPSALQASQTPAGLRGSTVRRLTPTECERLQGFPDGWTCLCGRNDGRSWPEEDACRCPDGPRYQALGNAVAVPVVEWLFRRIAEAL